MPWEKIQSVSCRKATLIQRFCVKVLFLYNINFSMSLRIQYYLTLVFNIISHCLNILLFLSQYYLSVLSQYYPYLFPTSHTFNIVSLFYQYYLLLFNIISHFSKSSHLFLILSLIFLNIIPSFPPYYLTFFNYISFNLERIITTTIYTCAHKATYL